MIFVSLCQPLLASGLLSLSAPLADKFSAKFADQSAESESSKKVKGRQDILLREISRQAWLICAREELAWATRDQALAESASTGLSLEWSGRFLPKAWSHEVSVGLGEDRKLLAQVKSSPKLLEIGVVDYLAYAQTMEAMSRSEMLSALQAQGADETTTQRELEVLDLEALPWKNMDAPSQLACLKALHQRRGHMSELELRVLVRVYAHLSVMTSHFWNASDKVFAARSLLYAQRLIALHGASEENRLSLAYALIWGGCYRSGLTMVKDLPSLRTSERDLLLAIARSDVLAFDALSQDSLVSQRAWLQKAVGTEYVKMIDYQAISVRAAIKALPYSFKVLDLLSHARGVGSGHQMSRWYKSRFNKTLPAHLKRLGLGVRAGKASPSRPVMRDIWGQLAMSLLSKLYPPQSEKANAGSWSKAYVQGALELDASSQQEPSHALSARWLSETHFQWAQQRLHFMDKSWGVPTEKEAQSFVPQMPEHPHLNMIKAYGMRKDEGRYQWLLDQNSTPPDYSNHDMSVLCDFLCAASPKKNPINQLEWSLSDSSYRDVLQDLHAASGKRKARLFSQLELLFPENHMVEGLLLNEENRRLSSRLKKSPKMSKAELMKAAELRSVIDLRVLKEQGMVHPYIQQAYITRFLKLKDWEALKLVSTQMLEKYPTKYAYDCLAKAHQELGNDELWLKTLEEYLEKGFDSGLSKTQVLKKISQHLLTHKELEKAWEYSEKAAKSWAAWAMSHAITCSEAVGKMDQAELWSERNSKRYSGHAFDHALWLMRHGRSDLESGRQYLFRDGKKRLTQQNHSRAMSVIDYMSGDRDQVFVDMGKQLDQYKSSYSAMHFGVLAQAHHRDDVLNKAKAMLNHPPKKMKSWDKAYYGLGRLMWGEASVAEQLDQKEVEKKVEALLKNQRLYLKTDVYYFYARYLENTYRPNLAREWYLKCVGLRQLRRISHALACAQLRQMGLDPIEETYRELRK